MPLVSLWQTIAMNRETQIQRIKPQAGTYALIMDCRVKKKVEVGKLGSISLMPGYYIYVGSAFGPGGLRARVHRHISESQKKHWHLDYIKLFTQPLEIWYSYEPVIREHQWAGIIKMSKHSRMLMKGFGSSDCSCETHLFFMAVRPQAGMFIKKIQEGIIECDQIHVLKLEILDNLCDNP